MDIEACPKIFVGGKVYMPTVKHSDEEVYGAGYMEVFRAQGNTKGNQG